jgi:hypothetical protein
MPANLTVAAARDATTRSRRIPGVGSPASSTKSQCRSILQRLDNRPVFPTYLAGECQICIKERNWGKCPDVSLYSRMESGVATTTRRRLQLRRRGAKPPPLSLACARPHNAQASAREPMDMSLDMLHSCGRICHPMDELRLDRRPPASVKEYRRTPGSRLAYKAQPTGRVDDDLLACDWFYLGHSS